MVSEADMKKKLFNLQKVETPIDWINQCGFDVKFVLNLEEVSGNESIVIPYNKCCFFELYEKYDEDDDFKIYPILDKRYWVVEFG